MFGSGYDACCVPTYIHACIQAYKIGKPISTTTQSTCLRARLYISPALSKQGIEDTSMADPCFVSDSQ